MKQLPLEWPGPGDRPPGIDLALEPTAIETLVGLMARAMVDVVRGAEPEEPADDR